MCSYCSNFYKEKGSVLFQQGDSAEIISNTFLGQIRRGCGNANSVTPAMFSGLFKKRWGITYAGLVKEGNCEIPNEIESSQTISNTPNCVLEDNILSAFRDLEEFAFLIEDENLLNDHIDASKFMEENAFVYVCGYLYKKYQTMHKCLYPLPTFEQLSYYNKYTFTQEKEFDKNIFVRPSEDIVTYVEQLNAKFIKHFDYCCHIVGIPKYLYKYLIQIRQYKCCENMDIDEFVDLFIRVRIYFVLKFFNREVAIPNLRYKVLKLLHI